MTSEHVRKASSAHDLSFSSAPPTGGPSADPGGLLRPQMSPTSVLHSLADLAAHGVDEAGGGCAVHPTTQGQEKPRLEQANQTQV